jgi:hypothetical protein
MTVKTEEVIIANLQDSLARIKAMVEILYVPEAMTLEKVKALARIAKLNVDLRESSANTEANSDIEIFNNLQEVSVFLIDQILNNKIIDDFQETVNNILIP